MNQPVKNSSFSQMPFLPISSAPSVTLSPEENIKQMQSAAKTVAAAYEGDKPIKGMKAFARQSEIMAMQLSLESTNAGNSFRLTFANL